MGQSQREGYVNKIAKRNCILRKLATTSWGALQSVLQTSTLALCCSAAEYCTPVWTRSPSTKLVNVKLRESMRRIGGCLKSTLIQWLPTIKLNWFSPHQKRRYDTENNQQNLGHGRQHTP
ncbi:RNA-directed DNA polymerase from mobile element jockey-like [Elysia marginata]|uniref:RNA-directed DNA polymerase from mobile element jockey-like n=1 Tax=Elysia marginata TaxID=1093978 RepID=A0AAV4FKC2_9GAST|nr:RNA-directed DNA polymerase from mobile element jockey-like [Elysia marginata]